jgi:hypothetical protein
VDLVDRAVEVLGRAREALVVEAGIDREPARVPDPTVRRRSMRVSAMRARPSQTTAPTPIEAARPGSAWGSPLEM